jgi:gliding motility-associated-like protein
MRLFLLAVLFVVSQLSPVSAQKQANVWHFGFFQSVDFSGGTPVLSSLSKMETFEGCVSYCDPDGRLLFYSNGGGRIPALSGQDGGTIWNRDNGIMYDMEGREGGGFSAVQSSVVVPKPGVSNRYYVFTMEEVEYNIGGSVTGQPLGRGLSYFDIDMTLNGGMGGVTDYKQSIFAPSYETLCAVQHANGTDYWVVISDTSYTKTYSFLVSGSGVATTPVESGGLPGFSSGIEASPNGRYMVAGGFESIILFNFNAATGRLSNPETSVPRFGFSEFSPNSKNLFVLDNDSLFYYKPGAGALVSTEQFVGRAPRTFNGGNYEGTTRLQLAPDGNIYFGTRYDTLNYLSVIECPNGVPKVRYNVLKLRGTEYSYTGLPNYADHIFAKEDPPLEVSIMGAENLCEGRTLTLDAGNTPGWQYTWSTGATTNTIQISTRDTFSVSVTDGCRFGADTVIIVAKETDNIPVPNAFTPNSGDDKNDSFKPATEYEQLKLVVYSRWGQIVYEGNEPWDGKVNGLDAPPDLYYYIADITICGELRQEKGDVTLLR